MSFFDLPRLNISGEFFTDPCTTNNDPKHYLPECTRPAPWQEPDGRHDFRLTHASVTSAIGPSGNHLFDPTITGATVSTIESPMPAKIADLDVYQQNVPTIYAMKIKITFNDKTELIGALDPATANGLQFNTVLPKRGWNVQYGWGSYGGDTNARALFQSVLRVDAKTWPNSKSPLLDKLRSQCAVEDGRILLSFRFIVDNYINDPVNPNFNLGRFMGVIGPQKPNEPTHCPGHRWLKARPLPEKADWWVPAFYDAPFVVDERRKVLAIDLSNSFCKTEVNGPFVNLESLTAKVKDCVIGPVNFSELVYQSAGGISEVPLTDEHLNLLRDSPLRIESSRTDIGPNPLLAESENGVCFAVDSSTATVPVAPGLPKTTEITTDGRLFRMEGNPKETAKCSIYATQWGKPLKNKQFEYALFPLYGHTAGATVPPDNPGNTPSCLGALECHVTPTDDNGYATAELTVVHDPGSRTPQLDGQVYYIVIYDPDTDKVPDLNSKGAKPAPQEKQISCLVWSQYPVNREPTWDDVREMMVPYAKLYRAMTAKIDLTDETAFKLYSGSPPYFVPSEDDPNVSAFYGVPISYTILDRINRGAIPFMLAADPLTDPRFMPVTRDLSPGKIKTILHYIQNNYFPPTKTPEAAPHSYHAQGPDRGNSNEAI